MLCTEYMARPAGSRFDPVLGCLKENQVGRLQLGFRGRQDADDLPVGFVDEAIHQRADAVVS